ncbi:Uncharacterised protein [Shigella flexneri]|nr:Uncharacterised protein [Shigella flexneri]
MFATKDAAHRQRLVVVGDDQSVSIQLRFSAIKQHQRFALFCYPHHNAAFNAIFIESVHRLAQFDRQRVVDGRTNRNDFRFNQRQLIQHGNVTRNTNDT